MPSTKRLNSIQAKTFGSRCRHTFSRFFLSWNLRSRRRQRNNVIYRQHRYAYFLSLDRRLTSFSIRCTGHVAQKRIFATLI